MILLVALVLTISLAGFVISAMGWVFIKLQEGKPIKRLFYILAVLGCIYWGGISYNGGRNVLNENILSRLQYDEDKGLSGNNRTSHLADAYFEQYTNNGQILFGVGNQTIRKSMEVLPKVQVLMIKLEAQAIRYFLCKMESCKL